MSPQDNISPFDTTVQAVKKMGTLNPKYPTENSSHCSSLIMIQEEFDNDRKEQKIRKYYEKRKSR